MSRTEARNPESGSYLCWIEGDQDESEARRHDYPYWKASATHAAGDFASWMADDGGYPDHVGEAFDVMVRDVDTGRLVSIRIGWEYDPRPTTGNEKEVEPANV